jgi:hypothetical protein
MKSVNHIPGFTDAEVAKMVTEAEAGYDLATNVIRVEPNPHFQKLNLVPEDLGEAIIDRAIHDGSTPAEVVRAALKAYLAA